MPSVFITSTGLTTGENLLEDIKWADELGVDEDQEIVIHKIGYTGSAVLRDHKARLYFGSVYGGLFTPTTIGVVVPLEARDILDYRMPREARSTTWKNLKLLANEAPTANQVTLYIAYTEVS